MYSRRQFLKQSAVVSLTPTLPAFISNAVQAARPAEENGRILVVIQLDGGNDGINTVVPYRDDGYEANRKVLRLPKDELITLDDEFAFHPRLRSASELFEEGRLSVVHGVGYPNPNRSHFESMAIWHAGTTEESLRHVGNGWLGDAISLGKLEAGPHTIHVGDETLPIAVRGRRCTSTTVANAADLQLRLDLADGQTAQTTEKTGSLDDFLTKTVSEAYVSADELASAAKPDATVSYPTSKLASRLKLVSQLIKSGAKAKVYYTLQSGYDTHAAQFSTHGNLLGELSSSLKAFMNDLRDSGLEDRVLVMAFSEFGRRVKENASFGTDHGTAGPVILAGTKLSKRSYGQLPSLTGLDGGDLKHAIDFRQLYGSVLSDWLGLERPSTLAEFELQGLLSRTA